MENNNQKSQETQPKNDVIDEQIRAKEVEFYSAAVTAWFNTALEHDKSLFALSSGGIGLLMTLITTAGVSSVELLILYACALTSFLICLVTVLLGFQKNKNYIEQVVRGVSPNDSTLAIIDTAALISFGIGVLFSVIIGISVAVNSYVARTSIMSNDSKEPNKTSGQNIANESYNGLANLQPQGGRVFIGNTFSGMAALQPQAQAASQTASQQAAQRPVSPQAGSGSGNDQNK